MNDKNKTQYDRILGFVKNRFGYILLVGVALISFNEVSDAWQDIGRRFGFVKTLDLTSDTEKSYLSKEIIRTAGNRMFWTRNYTEKVRKGASSHELSESWNKYIEATAKWSSELMIFYMGLDEFYPNSNKRTILEQAINPKFKQIAIDMANLKYSLNDSTRNHIEMVEKIQRDNNWLNAKLYYFYNEISDETD